MFVKHVLLWGEIYAWVVWIDNLESVKGILLLQYRAVQKIHLFFDLRIYV